MRLKRGQLTKDENQMKDVLRVRVRRTALVLILAPMCLSATGLRATEQSFTGKVTLTTCILFLRLW